MNLFQKGDFILHSGKQSWLKIDCDALGDDDLETLALLAIERLPKCFYLVEGVPSGGLRFAEALRGSLSRYATPKNPQVLIADDVLTSGGSMEEQRAGRDAHGIVIFARGKCPEWVTPLFTLGD